MDKTAELILVEEITNPDLLYRIYDEWLELWKRSSTATPFQSPAWIIPWWKTFGQGKLLVLCVRIDSRLIGLAPLYIYQLKDTHLRQATLIGTGNTDYLNILAEDEYLSLSAETVLSYLFENSSGWDICYFHGLPESSPLRNIKSSSDFKSELTAFNVCPVVSFHGSFEDYLYSLPASFRKNTKRASNNLKNSGRLSFETADQSTMHEFMNDIFQLHEKSWNERNSPGVLKGHEIKKFHLEAAKMLLKDKCLKLYRLRYNTLTIAAVYSMVKSDRLYYYIGGFEPEMKKYSPGSVLILSIMEDLIRKGVRKFDFLTGAETYKYNWGAEDEPIFRMIIRKAR